MAACFHIGSARSGRVLKRKQKEIRGKELVGLILVTTARRESENQHHSCRWIEYRVPNSSLSLLAPFSFLVWRREPRSSRKMRCGRAQQLVGPRQDRRICKIPILFHFFVLARASRKNKVEARKPSMMSPFKPDTYRFEHRGS